MDLIKYAIDNVVEEIYINGRLEYKYSIDYNCYIHANKEDSRDSIIDYLETEIKNENMLKILSSNIDELELTYTDLYYEVRITEGNVLFTFEHTIRFLNQITEDYDCVSLTDEDDKLVLRIYDKE